MKLEQSTLDNGLNTLFIDSPGSNVSSIQIWFKAGSSLEKKSNEGIAHFLEHMFFKGTKRYPDTMLAKTIESYGGEVNAFTSFDYTCYYINCPTPKTLTSLNVLLDMVSNPLFKAKDIPAEKEVVFEEFRRSLDSPSQFNFFELQKNSFSGSYAHAILGREKTIKAFDRNQLIDFRNQFYNLSNAFLIVAGDMSKKSIYTKEINKFKLPEGPRSRFKSFKLKDDSKISIHKKSTNQATITIAIQAPDYSDEKSAIEDLALNCLTYGDISPLYKELVSKEQIASSIGGSTLFFNKKGTHLLKIGLPPENINKFLKKFEKVLSQVLKGGFSLIEIDRIRNQYIASKVYEKETIESYAFSLGQGFAQTGEIHCEDIFIEAMRHCSRQEVHHALLDIFTKFLHITVQLPNDAKVKNLEESLLKWRKDLNTHAKKILLKSNKRVMQTSKFDPEVKCVTLKKNIELVYRHNKLTPTFALHAYLKGGVAAEDEKNNGIFNLLAKTMTYGHKETEYEELKTFFEHRSSYLNGFSGKNAYGLTLHGLSEHFQSLSHHFFKSLLEPSFPAQYVNLEKELLNRTFHIQKEDPIKHCFKAFNKLVFNNHPYSMDMIGSEKSIKNLSRKKIIEQHQKSLSESEIVFTYCGDKDLETVIEIINTHVSVLEARAKAKVKQRQVKPIYKVHKKIAFEREQTHVMIGKAATKISTKDDLFLKMFTTLLSGQSSDLFVKVRDEMGLCYSVQPLHLTALEAGYWGIYIGAGHDKKDLAIEAIFQILKKFSQVGITKKEFESIKQMMMGQNLLSVQTNDDYANFYSIPVLHNLGIDYQHKTYEKINQLDFSEFNKFLKRFLDDRWNLIEVGPNL